MRASSQDAYLAAIEFEAEQPRDPAGKEPSLASRYVVAKRILPLLQNKRATQKTTEATIRGWRKLSKSVAA